MQKQNGTLSVWVFALVGIAVSSVMAAPNLPPTALPQYISIDFVDRSNLYSSPANGSVLLPGGTFFVVGQEQFNVALLRSVEFGEISVPPPLTPPTQSGSVISQPANQQITSVVYDLQLTQIVQTAGTPGVVGPGSAFNLAFGPGTRQPLGGGTFTDLNADAPAGSGGVIAAFYDDMVSGTDAAPAGLAIGHQGAPGALSLSPIVADGSLTMIEAYPTVTDGTLLISGAFVPVTSFDIDTFYGPGSGILPSAGGVATVLLEKVVVQANGSVRGNFQGWVNFTGGAILGIGSGPQLGIYNLAGRTGSDMAIVGQVFAPSLSGIINVDPGGNPWNLGSTDPVGFAMKRCALEVTKTCVPSYKRTWDWDITKECVAVGNPPLPLNLSSGQTYPIDVAIKVCEKGYTDSDFAVKGSITVRNPCSDAAEIAGISDIVSPDIAVTVTECDGSPATFPMTLPANESHTWCYSAALPDKSTRTNTATVTTAATSPVDGGTAECTVDFTNVPPAEEIDECVTVSDEHCVTTPVQVCVGDSDLINGCKEFTCQVTVDCDDAPAFEDTATLTTNDTQTTKTDTCRVPIEPCGEGCSLTWGYWKTHAIPDCGNSGNPHPDATWLKLPGGLGSLTMFFISGMTYCDVLLTAPQGGNAYYILAHQYIAAQLNQLAGASIPADVLDAFNKATVLFQTYTPADLNKKTGTAAKQRAKFIGYAGLLASYNEGLVGPGHCDEAPLPGMSADAAVAMAVTLGEDPAAADWPADIGGPDTDLSGSVDLSDFLHFQDCFAGPNRVPAPGCGDSDFDGDNDVDLMDFTVFQACFNGPNRLPKCGG